MKMYPINSQYRLGEKLPDFTQTEVKNETMFFSSKPSFAYEYGGPITRAFLQAALGDPIQFGWNSPYFGYDSTFCFDSRVHMLMKGWWPAIPGWHHDDVPRSRGDGQPNYDTPEYHAKHILALVNGDICPTEFAVGSADYPHVDGKVYADWTHRVEEDIRDGVFTREQVPSNQLVHFDCNAFHQGTRAVGDGWRWFGRLTYQAGYGQGRPHHNEIRRQVNVYMDFPLEGW